MPDIHIERGHALGLPQARALAFRWAQAAEARFDLACTYEEGKDQDLVSFTRSGVNGELRVSADRFDLHARLGFLLGAFKDRIETEIARNLDALLAQDDPVAAFERQAADAPASQKARAAKTVHPRKA